MNESNAPARSSTIEPADVAPPRIMERVEAPITTPPIKAPVVKPADIAPSTIIKTKEPIPIKTPPKTVIKPSELAPPKTNTDLAIRENSIDYTDDEIKRNEIKQLRNLQKKKDRTESENDLFNTLKTKYTGVQPKPPKNIKQMNDAATSIQLAVKNRKARNEFADKYVDKLKDEYAKGKAGAHIRSAVKAKLYSKVVKDLQPDMINFCEVEGCDELNMVIDNLDNNVPTSINIDTYDDIARIENIDKNIPTGIDIDTYDEEARYLNNLSKNVPSFINIDTYSNAAFVINNVRNGRSIYSID
jgi:hypothetical protein